MTFEISHMKVSRVWAMPNKRTFQIKPIAELIARYSNMTDWIDPFPYPFKQDAIVYLDALPANSESRLLFDPPYSMRQLKECYESRGQAVSDTTCGLYARWKDAAARVIAPGGICISFGWSSNGLGQSRGFEIVEILLVAHGGCHNDTICTVERKVNSSLL